MTDLNATWNEATRGPRMSEATGKVIFKYQIPVKEVFDIELPKDAQIIRVADLDGMFWLWAIVDTNAPMEKRFFRAFKTGAKIPDDFDTSHYLGMCAVFIQMELGLYIFEDVQAKAQLERIKDRFQTYDAPERPLATMRELLQRRGIKTIDIALSEFEPGDMVGYPMPNADDSYQVNKENVMKWWFKAMAPFYAAPNKPLTQRNIDVIEAAGGFEEEDD